MVDSVPDDIDKPTNRILRFFHDTLYDIVSGDDSNQQIVHFQRICGVQLDGKTTNKTLNIFFRAASACGEEIFSHDLVRLSAVSFFPNEFRFPIASWSNREGRFQVAETVFKRNGNLKAWRSAFRNRIWVPFNTYDDWISAIVGGFVLFTAWDCNRI
jgi:hypothetical protein